MNKKAVSLETYVFIIVLFLSIFYFSNVMGLSNFFSTLMNTAYSLLTDTVFFIMAIAVLAGAFGAVLSEFGVLALINYILSPFTRRFYKLPGVASLGAITTYLSDNPAIISLAKNKEFKKYFRNYQIPVLCNLGTSYGMGLILTTVVISINATFLRSAVIGNIAAILGSFVSVRLMLRATKKYYSIEKDEFLEPFKGLNRTVRKGSALSRLFDSMLDGGKNGVQTGMEIIPGVLIICTFVMIFTYGPSDQGIYTGAAFEGVALLPKIGEIFNPVFNLLFGFTSPIAIAFPLTSLGSTGAAMGLIEPFYASGAINAKDVAVFVAIGMTWSGYLSTHVGMMDALGVRELTSKAIIAQTIGGLVAGVIANYLYTLSMFF